MDGVDPSTDGKEIELTQEEKGEIQDFRFQIPLSNEAINDLFLDGDKSIPSIPKDPEDLELYKEVLRARLRDRRETGSGLFRFKPGEIEKRLKELGYRIYENRGKFSLEGRPPDSIQWRFENVEK